MESGAVVAVNWNVKENSALAHLSPGRHLSAMPTSATEIQTELVRAMTAEQVLRR